MNCHEVSERLPWYVSGTLPEGEPDPIHAHVDACAACREELDRTRRLGAFFPQHPPAEVIVSLASPDAPETPEADAVREHLASCAACREELALARESAELVESQPADEATRVLPRLARISLVASGAAALFFVGLFVGQLTLRAPGPEPERLAGSQRGVTYREAAHPALEPQKNVPVLELVPAGSAVRGTPRGHGAMLRPNGAFAVLSLIYESAQRWDDYRLEVAGPNGTILWS